MARFVIPEANIERLRKKVKLIRSKCQKYGCDFKYEEVGDEYRTVRDNTGCKFFAHVFIVETTGTAVIHGWKLAAALEHTEKGNFTELTDDVDIPALYYNSPPICEHCHSNRHRKETFIVRNVNTGEYKQIGKSCLRDFTGGMSAEGSAAYASLLNEIRQLTHTQEGTSILQYFEAKEYLRFVAETIRCFGFISSRAASEDSERSTSMRAAEYMKLQHGGFQGPGQEPYRKMLQAELDKVPFNASNPNTAALVDRAIAWGLGLDEVDSYTHNLVTVCKMNYITARHMDVLASLLPSYSRTMRRQEYAQRRMDAYREAQSSVWVGEIDAKITVTVQSIKCVASWGSRFGTMHMYRIVDTNGNIFIWKTTTVLGDNVKTISGIVRDHNEFNGAKQTELTRCFANYR